MDASRTGKPLKPLCDTWPLEGLGGVTGTGKGNSFYAGGYGSAGGMGAMPFGVFDGLPGLLRRSVSGRMFLERCDLLDADPSDVASESPSPQGSGSLTFEEEGLAAKQVTVACLED